MDFVTLKNSYNSGDLLTALPGLQKIWEETGKKSIIYQNIGLPAFYYSNAEHPIKNDSGQQVCMNMATWELMKPLLEAQPYIEEARIWKGEKVQFDMDVSRDRRNLPLPYGNIHNWVWFIYPELTANLSKRWIHTGIDESYQHQYIYINRTSRYQNPYLHYYFLKKYEDKVMFIGLPEEHEAFCKQWELDIKYQKAEDFLELARLIDSAKGFIGNQSMCWHLADSMGVPRVLEYCAGFPNTHPCTPNGIAVLYQEALEYSVEKLINETK